MDDKIGVALVVSGAVVLLSGLIVGIRRSRSRELLAEEPLAQEPAYDGRDEIEQNLSAMRRSRGEIDL